jgi:hypothetical protein
MNEVTVLKQKEYRRNKQNMPEASQTCPPVTCWFMTLTKGILRQKKSETRHLDEMDRKQIQKAQEREGESPAYSRNQQDRDEPTRG